jgi:hypothetical protein
MVALLTFSAARMIGEMIAGDYLDVKMLGVKCLDKLI